MCIRDSITDFGTGFRIAVPTTALTAMTLAAREGVLVKGAQYLELSLIHI